MGIRKLHGSLSRPEADPDPLSWALPDVIYKGLSSGRRLRSDGQRELFVQEQCPSEDYFKKLARSIHRKGTRARQHLSFDKSRRDCSEYGRDFTVRDSKRSLGMEEANSDDVHCSSAVILTPWLL
jgi:hypothetical protein